MDLLFNTCLHFLSSFLTDISPSDPTQENGTVLVMNCTLTSGHQALNKSASDLHFQMGTQRLDNFTYVLNDYTAQLRWPVNSFYKGVHMLCFLQGHTTSGGNPRYVAQTTFTVAGKALCYYKTTIHYIIVFLIHNKVTCYICNVFTKIQIPLKKC